MVTPPAARSELEIYASTLTVCGLWMLVVFSYLAQKNVKLGDIDDPHNNSTYFEKNIAVCNFDLVLAGLGSRTENTDEDIECYRKAVVNRQTRTVWKECNDTMYDMLHDRRNDQVIHCIAYIEPIDGRPRTTPWTQAQTLALERVVSEAVNEWRKVLVDQLEGDEHQFEGDFYKFHHQVKLVAIVEPDPATPNKLRTYESLHDDARSLLRISDLADVSVPLTATKLKAVRSDVPECPTLSTHGIDLTIHFSAKAPKEGDILAWVKHDAELDTNGYLKKKCFSQGVAIHINDALEFPDIRVNVYARSALTWFAVIFISLMGLFVVLYRDEISPAKGNQRELAKIVAVSIPFSVLFARRLASSADPALPPVVNGHPTRFAIDFYSLFTLLHELGHTLLLNDHYEVNKSTTGEEILSFPGPRRPFTCKSASGGPMKPISVMASENAITKFDRHIVRSMWALLRHGAEDGHAEDGAEIIHDANTEQIIQGLRDVRDSACAGQANGTTTPGPTSNGTTTPGPTSDGTTECDSKNEKIALYERSCRWVNELGRWVSEPADQCNIHKTEHVPLASERSFVQFYMSHFGTGLEIGLASLVTFLIILPEPSKFLRVCIILTILLCTFHINQKAWQIRRCVGVNDSIANYVTYTTFLILIPLAPIVFNVLNTMAKQAAPNSPAAPNRSRQIL